MPSSNVNQNPFSNQNPNHYSNQDQNLDPNQYPTHFPNQHPTHHPTQYLRAQHPPPRLNSWCEDNMPHFSTTQQLSFPPPHLHHAPREPYIAVRKKISSPSSSSTPYSAALPVAANPLYDYSCVFGSDLAAQSYYRTLSTSEINDMESFTFDKVEQAVQYAFGGRGPEDVGHSIL